MKKEHWLIISDDQIKIKPFITDTDRKVYTTDLLKLFQISLIKTFSVENLNFSPNRQLFSALISILLI